MEDQNQVEGTSDSPEEAAIDNTTTGTEEAMTEPTAEPTAEEAAETPAEEEGSEQESLEPGSQKVDYTAVFLRGEDTSREGATAFAQELTAQLGETDNMVVNPLRGRDVGVCLDASEYMSHMRDWPNYDSENPAPVYVDSFDDTICVLGPDGKWSVVLLTAEIRYPVDPADLEEDDPATTEEAEPTAEAASEELAAKTEEVPDDGRHSDQVDTEERDAATAGDPNEDKTPEQGS